MKRFVSSLLFLICTVTSMYGQTYLDNLQKKVQGEGNVTVTQSQEIDDLVNGTNSNVTNNTPQRSAKTSTPVKSDYPQDILNKKSSEQENKNQHLTNKEPQIHEPAVKRQEQETKKLESENKDAELANEEVETPSVDMRKKVMRGGYKVTGYRIQAFAGGNSRKDRQQAEKIGNAIKIKYPDQPVYVHFYSPRWICRVGNYRELSEAQVYLKRIRAMGYKSACLVKGKITVQK